MQFVIGREKGFTQRCKGAKILPAVKLRRWGFKVQRVLAIYILGLITAPAFAAQNITPARWQQLTQDKAFSYKNDIEAIQPVKQYEPGLLMKILRSIFNFLGNGAGNILLWIIVSCIVVYIVYRLFFSGDSFIFGRSKKTVKETGAPHQEEEEDLATTNWEALLQQATGNNDLRLAVRYSYKWLLQLLQQRELIQYRNDKTNYEYYAELNETGYKQPFKQLSRQYEYAWYGHFTLSPAAYSEYIALFNNTRKQLGA